MKAALLLLVLLIRGPSVVTMHGRVTDSSTGKAISAVSIVIPALNLGTHTDSLGRYTLSTSSVAANSTVTT